MSLRAQVLGLFGKSKPSTNKNNTITCRDVENLINFAKNVTPVRVEGHVEEQQSLCMEWCPAEGEGDHYHHCQEGRGRGEGEGGGPIDKR